MSACLPVCLSACVVSCLLVFVLSPCCFYPARLVCLCELFVYLGLFNRCARACSLVRLFACLLSYVFIFLYFCHFVSTIKVSVSLFVFFAPCVSRVVSCLASQAQRSTFFGRPAFFPSFPSHGNGDPSSNYCTATQLSFKVRRSTFGSDSI